MKFTWFHLVPYRWLPADFRQRDHGVWVDVPNSLYDPERGPCATGASGRIEN